MMQQIRGRMQRFTDFADRRSATSSHSHIGGGNFDIDFVFRGPDLVQLPALAEQLRTNPRSARASSMPNTTLKLDKPELQVRIDRARAADLGVDTEHIADRAARSWSAATSRSRAFETPR